MSAVSPFLPDSWIVSHGTAGPITGRDRVPTDRSGPPSTWTDNTFGSASNAADIRSAPAPAAGKGEHNETPIRTAHGARGLPFRIWPCPGRRLARAIAVCRYRSWRRGGERHHDVGPDR